MPKKAHKNSHLVGQEVTLTGKVDRVVGHDGVWCWVRLRASENVVKVHVRDLGNVAKPEPPKAGQHVVDNAPLPSLPVPPPPPAGITDSEAAAFLDTFTWPGLADQRRTVIEAE